VRAPAAAEAEGTPCIFLRCNFFPGLLFCQTYCRLAPATNGVAAVVPPAEAAPGVAATGELLVPIAGELLVPMIEELLVLVDGEALVMPAVVLLVFRSWP